MNPSIVTAVAAACGSLVGAAATIATTWITLRAQTTLTEREEKFRRREALYAEFITEASRLTIEALSRTLEEPATFVHLYGILGRIPLVAVVSAAEACARQIVDLHVHPNLTVEQIRLAFERDQLDPVRDFSVAYRRELIQIGGDG